MKLEGKKGSNKEPAYIAAEKSGTLNFLMYSPTGPGNRSKDKEFKLGSKFKALIGTSGGRLFGFGVEFAGLRDQLFRIDWLDDRSDWKNSVFGNPIDRLLHVHYHVHDSKEHWTIWAPSGVSSPIEMH